MKATNIRSLYVVLDGLRLGSMSDSGKLAMVKTLRNVARVSDDIEQDMSRLLSKSKDKATLDSIIESEYDVKIYHISESDMERLILANPDVEIGKFVFISRFIEEEKQEFNNDLNTG